MRKLAIAAIAVFTMVCVASRCDAAITVEAADNATIQPAGPRTGDNGKNFFNVQGSNNGTFASFGVADFNFGTPAIPFASVSGITVDLVQSNAGFSAAGPVNIYLSGDLTSDIQPGTSSLTYIAPGEGLGSQLTPLFLLGSGEYAVRNDGDLDSYQFTSLDQATQDYVLGQINTSGRLRVVVAPNAPGVSATWAGFSNANFAGPTLTVNAIAVPEPSAIGLLSVLALGFLGRRSTRRA